MALIEEFESQGNFLFRWRSYIPGIILILCLGLLPFYRFPGDSYNYHLYYQSFCFVISILGLFVRSFVIGYAPARTSGRNTKEQVADLVNQEGIYSLIRHPLYVGNFLMYLGAVLFLKNFLIAAVFILFSGYITKESCLRKNNSCAKNSERLIFPGQTTFPHLFRSSAVIKTGSSFFRSQCNQKRISEPLRNSCHLQRFRFSRGLF
ncbi:phospholipid methyltransferase domain protein [Leptospira borgpetersenii str. Noumea 25]|nr:phospholipid methyltransferase domain protein [Leptospira borgpetersenii str. Noumea 25]